MTLYQIKPLFQSLLRPTMFWLYKHHVTANHITLAALALSLLTGLLLMLVAQPILFMLLPIVLFIRTALNALDGMLARECNQQTRLGAILNETGDVISDIARKSMHFFFNCTPVKTISMFSFSYKNKDLAKLSFFSL